MKRAMTIVSVSDERTQNLFLLQIRHRPACPGDPVCWTRPKTKWVARRKRAMTIVLVGDERTQNLFLLQIRHRPACPGDPIFYFGWRHRSWIPVRRQIVPVWVLRSN